MCVLAAYFVLPNSEGAMWENKILGRCFIPRLGDPANGVRGQATTTTTITTTVLS